MNDWNWKNILAAVAGVVIVATAVISFTFPDGILNGADGNDTGSNIPCFEGNATIEASMPGISEILAQANRNRGDDC